MFQTFLQKGRKNLGYTIDQTILVVAVIAILITLIIASVGWDLITRAGGTKLASQLGQIQDSIGTFYGTHGMWPDTAIDTDAGAAGTANAADNLLILKVNNFTAGTRFEAKHQNLLSAIKDNGNNLLSPAGDGNQIMDMERQDPSNISSSYAAGSSNFVIRVVGVPVEEAIKADTAIDGVDDITAGDSAGRVILLDDTGACDGSGNAADGTASLVTICYIANTIN